MRPPSEAYSLLLRVVRGCPWNRCTFCNAYKDTTFAGKADLRHPGDLKSDIDMLRAIADSGVDVGFLPWLSMYGAHPETAFLGDSNALVHRTDALVEVLDHLLDTFPSIERVTSYARAKTVLAKRPSELQRLRAAGLSRLHLGLESGADDVLDFVRKGATADEMIDAGRAVKAAGFELSEYVMPGLGGRSMSRQHAEGTVRVLNAVDPDYVRMRPLAVMPDTPLFDAYRRVDFEPLRPHEVLREVRQIVEALEITGRVCFDHHLNPMFRREGRTVAVFRPDHEGYRLPDERPLVLALIDRALEVEESSFRSLSPGIEGFRL